MSHEIILVDNKTANPVTMVDCKLLSKSSYEMILKKIAGIIKQIFLLQIRTGEIVSTRISFS